LAIFSVTDQEWAGLACMNSVLLRYRGYDLWRGWSKCIWTMGWLLWKAPL